MIQAPQLSADILIPIANQFAPIHDTGEALYPGGTHSGAIDPQPQSQESATSAAHTPTVLLIEDDEPTRLAMMSWLVGEGFSVLAAANGHEAAGHLERPLEPIDVVVLDVGLPDVDGVALCGRIRELYPQMPVIVCTGGASPIDVARLVGLGATRYFRKPVDPDELLSVVEAVLP